MDRIYEMYQLADNSQKLTTCLNLIPAGSYNDIINFMASLYNSDYKVRTYVECRKLFYKPTEYLTIFDLVCIELPIVASILKDNINQAQNKIYNY